MKAYLFVTLILSSIFIINSTNVKIGDNDNILNKCAAESIKEGISKMLDSFQNDRTNISSLISETKTIVSRLTAESVACMITNFKNNNGYTSRLSDFGYLLLKTSNCLKDVGPVFIILDNVISSIQQETKDWQNIIVSSVLLGILTNQSYNDCKSLYDSLINFNKSQNK